MNTQELKRLEKIDERIQEIAKEDGLNTIPIDFEVVPAQRMFEVMAYGLPVNFRHWSKGRDYERLRTIYENSGAGLPYEMVLNTNPPKAFLMETNPFPIQVLVVAHVYAHVDFFMKNQLFKNTSKDMIVQAYEAAKRFNRYEQYYGLSQIEPVIDAGLALQFNVDPEDRVDETREQQIDRLYGVNREEFQRPPGDFEHLYPREKKKRPDSREISHKTPLEPARDILSYIIGNSPRPLDDWEQDVLSVIRAQGLYLYPQIRTKITNEGWAAYWHEQIMRRLFEEKYLTSEEHGYFANYHSAVLQPNPFQLNPYYVGKAIFADIKDRWDKGKVGKAWRECENEYEIEYWDKKWNQGLDKIFKVRQFYSDRMLIEHFLTDELVHKLKLYIYQERQKRNGDKELVIVESRPEVIRQQLKEFHSDAGQPRILVADGNYKQNRELLLKHKFQSAPLDYEYLQKTLEHIYFLWGRPVHLKTKKVKVDKKGKVSTSCVICHYNGETHTEEDLRCGPTCSS